MEFSEYQRASQETDKFKLSSSGFPLQATDRPDNGSEDSAKGSPEESIPAGILIPLMGLVSEAGSLMLRFKKYIRDKENYIDFKFHVKEELGDILWYVSNLATKTEHSLEEIAEQNLNKTRSRWLDSDGLKGRKSQGAQDIGKHPFPPEQQFPEEIRVLFTEEQDGTRKRARLYAEIEMFGESVHSASTSIDGKELYLLGDSLTDNSYSEDAYRFHDIMHFAFVARLGWSPVARKLLKRKRRADSTLDEVEDGGRAQVIDEALVALAFDYGRRNKLLGDSNSAATCKENCRKHSIDAEFFDVVQRLVLGRESEHFNNVYWERAFLDGFSAWNELIAHTPAWVKCTPGKLLEVSPLYEAPTQ